MLQIWGWMGIGSQAHPLASRRLQSGIAFAKKNLRLAQRELPQVGVQRGQARCRFSSGNDGAQTPEEESQSKPTQT